MFINKNVKYWKNSISVFTELLCDGGDNDEGGGVEVDGDNKDVGVDNGNAGDGENKVDLGDVYNGGGDSNDDVGVDDVGRVNTSGRDDTDLVMVTANLIVVLIEALVMVMIKRMVVLMMMMVLTLIVFQLFIHFFDTDISATNNHARTFVHLFITMLLSSGNPLLHVRWYR